MVINHLLYNWNDPPSGKLTAGTQKWRWMEDDVPVQLGDFLGSMLIFQGCTQQAVTVTNEGL